MKISNKKFVIPVAVSIFALISVFGISIFTGNKQQSNVVNTQASAQEPSDINNDNKVDVFDLSILLSKWNTADATSDITNDGTVNIFDLSVLLSDWGVIVTPTPTPTSTPTPTPTTTPTPTPPVTSCPTYPGFPSPSCTGWQHTGVTLAACEQYVSGGDYVITGTAGGRVVDGCDFHDRQVVIKGGGPVTLKRSRVKNNSSCDSACAAIYIDNGAGNVLIEDVEVTTTNPNVTDETQRQDRTISVNKNNTLPVTINRVYAHDTTRGVDITGQNNIVISNSFLAYNNNPGVGERKHSSAVRAAGGVYNVQFVNTVLGVGVGSWASGLLAFYPEGGANHDITIDGGLWEIKSDNSGAYGIAVGYTPGVEDPNYNFTIKNLQISTVYYSEGCPSGCGQNWTGTKAPTGIKLWQNVTKYNPGQPDHGQAIGP